MMIINPQNPKNHNQLSFKGKIANFDDLNISRKFVNSTLNGLWDNLSNSIKKEKPNLIQNVDGIYYAINDTPFERLASSSKSLFSMPIDIIDSIAKKFPNSSLNNSEFLKKHRNNIEFEENIHALQGLQKNGAKFAKEYMLENKLDKLPTRADKKHSKGIQDFVSKKFIRQLNDTMAENVGNYDSKKERFVTRLVSGFTAAIFLGKDFFNKAIQKGKTKEEAAKEQRLKQNQEIKENICEAITQFAVFACFSKTINKSPWAPAIIGAGIGIVSRIISRLSSGMRLTRIDASKQPNRIIPSINEFIESAEGGDTDELMHKKQQKNIEDAKKEDKKPLLNLKNIALFCASSIIGGYALRFGKNHTKIGKSIADAIACYQEKYNNKIIEETFATPDKLKKLADTLRENKNEEFYNHIKEIINKNDKADKISLGTDFKTKKLFGKFEVKVKDLKAIKWAPINFIKELVSYPYKIAAKLEEAIRNSKIIKNGGKIPKKPELTDDKYGIKNLYKTFLEFEQKSNGDDAKLTKEFGDYVNKMILKANNEVTSSKGDNSKIAVLAQTLGTLTGMWFNMNDEFNASIRNGSTKAEANKDARLRGINKFFRMTVQVVISGSLNSIFIKQYNSSLLGSAVIVAVSTILTDIMSRVLTAMPSKKMTKEEIDKYQMNQKQGSMRWYYDMIDKLAS